jgi:hypothetical protein
MKIAVGSLYNNNYTFTYHVDLTKNCKIKGCVKLGKQRKTEDWYFFLPWS